MRRLLVLLALAVLPLVLPAPAAAHHLIVTPPGKDGPVHGAFEHWVGGPTPLPAQAQGGGLIFSPGAGGMIPAAHDAGLVQACLATRANGNGVVQFAPPPFGPADADCRHYPPSSALWRWGRTLATQ